MNDERNLTAQTDVPQNVMTTAQYEAAIEAILFAAGHPITYEQLAKTFEIPVSELKSIVEAYAKKYNESSLSRGVSLIIFDTCCQLCTKPEHIGYIRNALGIRKTAGTLSASTIEALTIVAYQQPVTRAYVDSVRNADSSYAMSNLLDRGLIEAKGRKDVPGRPILYGTTNAFLRCFGLHSLDDLPGSQGEADKIFTAIDSRLNLSSDGGVEGQFSIDDVMNGIMPSLEPTPETRVEEVSQVSIGDLLEEEETAPVSEAEVEEAPVSEPQPELEPDLDSEINATEEAQRYLDE